MFIFFFKSQCTVCLLFYISFLFFFFLYFFFLSDTLLAYWNKFSPQELINVLVLLEWVWWGWNSNTAPLCGQHWPRKSNESDVPRWVHMVLGSTRGVWHDVMKCSTSLWGETGVYGGNRVKWQCPVLSPCCAEGVPTPRRSRARGPPSCHNQHNLCFAARLVERMGEETGVGHRVWKPRVWVKCLVNTNPKLSCMEECVCRQG